jgi:hypothetical protein
MRQKEKAMGIAETFTIIVVLAVAAGITADKLWLIVDCRQRRKEFARDAALAVRALEAREQAIRAAARVQQLFNRP